MTMTMNRPGATSRDYEREAEATRHRLAQSLDELNDRLTPGQVFDEVLTYARGGSGTFARAVGNAAKENPVPSLLIGAGCLLFLSERLGFGGIGSYLGSRRGSDGHSRIAQGMSRSSERGYDTHSRIAEGMSSHSETKSRRPGFLSRLTGAASSTMDSATGTVRSGMQSATDTAGEQVARMSNGISQAGQAVGDTFSSAADRMSQTAREVGEQASSTAEQIRRRAEGLGDTVQQYSANIGEQMAETAEAAKERASVAARQVKEKATSLIHEQPLVVAAIGLAIGAALAAALPKSRTEDELMGEASDAVKSAVGGMASQRFEQAKSAAGELAESAIGAVGNVSTSDVVKRVMNGQSESGSESKPETRDMASASKPSI
jgi:ElaB/YqjD/DUF883 family membrane-anchored ribosome-binding protein